MYLKPLNGRLVVKRLDAETESPGGIILPDMAQKQNQRGLVFSASEWVDPHGNVRTPDVGPGDEILFPKYVGEEILIGSDKYLLIKHDDVLARVVSEPK